VVTDARQIDEMFNGSQQMVGGNVIGYRKPVKQCTLRVLLWSQHPNHPRRWEQFFRIQASNRHVFSNRIYLLLAFGHKLKARSLSNNLAENLAVPFQRRERAMLRFRQMRCLQKTAVIQINDWHAYHSAVQLHLPPQNQSASRQRSVPSHPLVGVGISDHQRSHS
jgi:hypothetical protein